MWVNTFETLPYGRRGRYFFEPLPTAAPRQARPYCCYVRTVIFYKHPLTVVRSGPNKGMYAEWDRVDTIWDSLGHRWTQADIGWNSLAPLVLFFDPARGPEVYELAGGTVVWREGLTGQGWQMQRLGWRLWPDDRRWPEICELITRGDVLGDQPL